MIVNSEILSLSYIGTYNSFQYIYQSTDLTYYVAIWHLVIINVSQSLQEYDTENYTEKPELWEQRIWVTLKNFQWNYKGLTF